MYVGLYDEDKYYESEVYAIINTGYTTRYLLKIEDEDGEFIRFYEYLDKSGETPVIKIDMINSDHPQDWFWRYSEFENTTLREYEDLIDENVEFFIYGGPKWLFEERILLSALVNGEIISVKGSLFEEQVLKEKSYEWMKVCNDDDIQKFLNLTGYLHDTVIKEISYLSGAYVDSGKSMYPFADLRKIRLSLDSQMSDSIEMVFEKVKSLDLRPLDENYTSEILECNLRFLKDGSLEFCDNEPVSYNTKIVASNLSWRFIREE